MPLLFQSTASPLAHQVLELLAYFIGARLYWAQARHAPQTMPRADQWLVLASAIFGAMLGSKLLHVLEHAHALRDQPWMVWLAGKSLLGGLLGGTLGVELAKRSVGWRHSTGDAWVLPLAVGIVIGRLGCQYSGLWDQTYGNPTGAAWGWDYGDGVPRHPVALYEAGLVALAAWGTSRCFKARAAGLRYALFLATYCAARLLLEGLKPPFAPAAAGTLTTELYAGLTPIQWAALAGLAYFIQRCVVLRSPPTPAAC